MDVSSSPTGHDYFLDLETSQIDYTAAFVHVPIDYLVYVQAPVGFHTQIGDIDCV